TVATTKLASAAMPSPSVVVKRRLCRCTRVEWMCSRKLPKTFCAWARSDVGLPVRKIAARRLCQRPRRFRRQLSRSGGSIRCVMDVFSASCGLAPDAKPRAASRKLELRAHRHGLLRIDQDLAVGRRAHLEPH